MIFPPWVKYLAGIAIAAVIYVKGYSDGKDAERGRWLEKEVAATEAKVKREGELQAQVDAAGLALSMSSAELERIKAQTRIETRTYYVQNPGNRVACLAPERVRSVAESDAAATKNPAAASASPQ